MTKKKLGVGAKCTILMKFLHPSKVIADKYPNQTAHSVMENCLCVGRDQKKIRNQEKDVVIFCHDDLPNKVIYCVPKWPKVNEEGAAEHFFEETMPTPNIPDDGNTLQEEQQQEIPQEVQHARNVWEDIALVRAMGFMVDDDNNPAPENIPVIAENVQLDVNNNQTWGWNGANQRALFGAENNQPKFSGLDSTFWEVVSFTRVFLLLFPRTLVEKVILAETNKKIDKKITLGEFLRFIGLWLVITYASPGNLSRKEFWSSKKLERERGAPFRLNDLMSSNRFEDIIKNLTFTNRQPPAFKDKFWEIRQMVEEWNNTMRDVFIPGWISCLDESMSIWYNKWTCPGYVFCPRKPHPFGNEYHSICCGLCGILFRVEMVEGKDRPSELPSDPPTAKTTNLLLRLCRKLYGTGKVVILDSGFCVLAGLIALRKVGVFAGALIKKRRYWPKHVPGDMIDDYFKDKDVGEVDSLKGILDNIHYDIFCMKEPDYVMKIMSTYGGLIEKDGQKLSERKYKVGNEERSSSFRYKIPFSNHFDYRHVVDDHNGLRHMKPSIEEVWGTNRWATRVFSFLLAVTEVNCYLAFRYFVWKDEDQRMEFMSFRSKFAWALINNEYIASEEAARTRGKKRNRENDHCYVSAPPHAKTWMGTKWNLSASQRYQQHRCSVPGCNERTRKYCQCSVGVWYCQSCFTNHCIESSGCVYNL